MSHDIRMPSLGMAMDEGQVVAWHVKPGDTVRPGQVVLDIESEKTTAEIETPVGGVVGELLVAIGATVPVDTVLVRIGDGASAPAARPVATGRGNASPRAKKLAQELGVDLSKLAGSGPGGSIVEADIRAAAAKAPREDYVLRPLSPIARRVADRTAESARTAPHFFVSSDIDASGLERCRGAHGATINDLILWAAARVLPSHPLLNASYADDGLHEWKDVHLGVVAATQDGLVAPVIRNASTLPLETLVNARTDLIGRARAGKLSPDDMVGGTFSVSNLGGFGVERFNSILHRGQSAILSVGAIKKKPAVIDGSLGIGPVMALTLTVDHRVVDGVAAAKFLGDLGTRLETMTVEGLEA
ncbi:MAG TPA: dihydrolipoamide acetyltransferase family protein [Rhizomicrobium sp.]|nr:dihydrolipoamide acetyltransferase family protein [Rhizomicrobium sp.]